MTFWTRFDQTLREDERQQIESATVAEKTTAAEEKPLDDAYNIDTEGNNHVMLTKLNSPDGLDQLPKKMCHRGDKQTQFMLDTDKTGDVIVKGLPFIYIHLYYNISYFVLKSNIHMKMT